MYFLLLLVFYVGIYKLEIGKVDYELEKDYEFL